MWSVAPVSATTREAADGTTNEAFTTLEERVAAMADGRIISEDGYNSKETLQADM